MKFNFMLRKKIEFTVTKTRAEVLERINKLIQYSDYVNGYVYNRKDYDFVIIKPSSPIANSFKPVFCGKVLEEANTTRILLTIRMKSFIETILIVLAVISLLSFLPTLISMDFTDFRFESFPVFALIMVLVGIVIFNLSINFQLKILKGRLSQ